MHRTCIRHHLLAAASRGSANAVRCRFAPPCNISPAGRLHACEGLAHVPLFCRIDKLVIRSQSSERFAAYHVCGNTTRRYQSSSGCGRRWRVRASIVSLSKQAPASHGWWGQADRTSIARAGLSCRLAAACCSYQELHQHAVQSSGNWRHRESHQMKSLPSVLENEAIPCAPRPLAPYSPRLRFHSSPCREPAWPPAQQAAEEQSTHAHRPVEAWDTAHQPPGLASTSKSSQVGVAVSAAELRRVYAALDTRTLEGAGGWLTDNGTRSPTTCDRSRSETNGGGPVLRLTCG